MRGVKTCFRIDKWGVHGTAGLNEPICVDCVTDEDREAVKKLRLAAAQRSRVKRKAENRKGWRTATADEFADDMLEDLNDDDSA